MLFETDICIMNQTYCVALVFSRKSYRYRAYARQYTEALLTLQKHVIIVSPDCLELQHELLVKFRSYSEKLSFISIEEITLEEVYPRAFELIKRYFKLTRYLKSMELSIQTKIDLVYFAPLEDWVKPKFKKWIFKKIFPYSFTGLITRTKAYEDGSLRLNVDPKYNEADYLLSSENCIGVCTLDRFNTEKIRSRIYRKVILMPDITDIDIQEETFELGQQIRRMAKGRMLIGAIILDAAFPFEFLDIIKNAPDDLYFFVIIGEISSISFSFELKNKLNELMQSEKLNYFIKTDFEANKKETNMLIKALDVVYIGFDNKEVPAVVLSKAAKFEKPVIAYKCQFTSKLVLAFKLGLVIGDDYYSPLDALQVLRLQLPLNLNYDFDAIKTYSKLQEQKYLKQSWEELLWF